MKSIVLQLQNEALDKAVAVSDLLRRAYVVARKLRISEMETWVKNELEGYKDATTVPEYRQVRGIVEAWNPFHGWQPVMFEDNNIQEDFAKRPCVQAIAEIESLIGGPNDKSNLQMPFSAAAEALFRKALDFDTQITLMVPKTSMVRIVDAVRTVVLNWSMKLEEDGILGDGLAFTSTERETATKASYNTNNFYGSVQDSQIQQQTSQSIQTLNKKNVDVTALKELLCALQENRDDLGLNQETSKEFSSEVKTLQAQAESPVPKPSIILEGIASVRRIIEGAAGTVAAKFLLDNSHLFEGIVS